MTTAYIDSARAQFKHYKSIGEKCFEKLNDEELFIQHNDESNSIAVIVKHLWGNMMSRWTDFLITDGEKESRKRDEEFEPTFSSREEMMKIWNEGWECLFSALDSITEDEIKSTTIYIRGESHSITEAINRQLAHYPYHVGQIVLLTKMISTNWTALTIPRGNSNSYNKEKFTQKNKTT